MQGVIAWNERQTFHWLMKTVAAGPEGSTSLTPKLPLDTILSQFHWLNIVTPNFYKIHLNVILPPSRSSECMFPKIRCHQNPVRTYSLSPILAAWPAHRGLLDFTICTVLGDLYSSQSFSLCNIINYSLTSSFLGTNIFKTLVDLICVFPESERPRLIPIQIKWRNYCSVYPNPQRFVKYTGR
jgi:hypothetical protein